MYSGTMRVDLNGDVGEASSGRPAGNDSDLMPHLTSANVACGFHAGDPGVMRATVSLASEHGVAVGAHPSFPDPEGFGRREIQFSPLDVEEFVAYQVGALAAIAAAQGVRLQHVKPHGALFNMAVRDAALADAIARAAAVIDRTLILVGLPGSEIVVAGKRAGLRTACEGYADREYEPDGDARLPAAAGSRDRGSRSRRTPHGPVWSATGRLRLSMEAVCRSRSRPCVCMATPRGPQVSPRESVARSLRRVSSEGDRAGMRSLLWSLVSGPRVH